MLGDYNSVLQIKRVEIRVGRGDGLRKSEFLIMGAGEILRFKVSIEGEIQAKRAIKHDLGSACGWLV